MSPAPSGARDAAIWAILALFAAFTALKPFLGGTAMEPLIPAVTILMPLGFALLHGSRQLGWRRFGLLFAITFAVSWGYESLSIATGFPFGHYHYTDRLGPKLGQVPLLIMPAYFAVCYTSWFLALLLLDRLALRADRVQTWAVPPLAALIMVMWDMGMDPARATVHQAWIWHDGGGYMGVPFQNFMGWVLCVWTVFQLFALALRRAPPAPPAEPPRRGPWLQLLTLYGALALEFVSLALFPPTGSVTDPAGVVWSQQAIYETLGLVAIFSMGFVTLLGVVKVYTTPGLAPRER